jgi:RNA polymerase sigma-70 factor (ECF subfamily)
VGRNRDELYREAVAEFGPALDRVAAAYEADRERRSDLRQEIHFQLWRSFERFDGRCSARTWAFRVAHNVAISHVNRERRRNTRLVSLEEVQQPAAAPVSEPDMDRDRALTELRRLILQLKPLDRQIVSLYLEEMDAASIAEVTGLSAANVAMKVSRIKTILAERFAQERRHAG